MGLRIKPGDACWSYSGFNDFRRLLAREEGIDLDAMEGFGGLRGVPAGTRTWAEVESPLVPLLNHSDCEGYLSADDCEQMLPRLHEIAKKWIGGGQAALHPAFAYDVEQLTKLIDGMEHSVLFGCSVVFS